MIYPGGKILQRQLYFKLFVPHLCIILWITTVSGTKIAAVKAQWNAERPMTLVGAIHTAGELLRGGGRNAGVKEIDQK